MYFFNGIVPIRWILIMFLLAMIKKLISYWSEEFYSNNYRSKY
jgi:hypothetical protein